MNSLEPSNSFIQLFGVKDERKEGVYAIDIVDNTIETKDSESNYFQLNVNGQVNYKVAVSFDIVDQND